MDTRDDGNYSIIDGQLVMNAKKFVARANDLETATKFPELPIILRVNKPRKDKYFLLKYVTNGRLQIGGQDYIELDIVPFDPYTMKVDAK